MPIETISMARNDRHHARGYWNVNGRATTSLGDKTLAALIEENEASAEVTTVYADIKATRGVDWVNNFWKAIANHPATLKRMWDGVPIDDRFQRP